MARASDAVTGIILAAIGILIIVAWRSGTLRQIVSGQPRSENTARQAGVDARDVASRLPPTGGALRVPGGGFGAVALGGVPDNGFTSMPGSLATQAEFAGGIFCNGAFAFAHDIRHNLAGGLNPCGRPLTTLPNAAELIPSTRPQEIRENSRKLTPAELSPFSVRGQEIRENTRPLREDELADPLAHGGLRRLM